MINLLEHDSKENVSDCVIFIASVINSNCQGYQVLCPLYKLTLEFFFIFCWFKKLTYTLENIDSKHLFLIHFNLNCLC